MLIIFFGFPGYFQKYKEFFPFWLLNVPTKEDVVGTLRSLAETILKVENLKTFTIPKGDDREKKTHTHCKVNTFVIPLRI